LRLGEENIGFERLFWKDIKRKIKLKVNIRKRR